MGGEYVGIDFHRRVVRCGCYGATTDGRGASSLHKPSAGAMTPSPCSRWKLGLLVVYVWADGLSSTGTSWQQSGSAGDRVRVIALAAVIIRPRRSCRRQGFSRRGSRGRVSSEGGRCLIALDGTRPRASPTASLRTWRRAMSCSRRSARRVGHRAQECLDEALPGVAVWRVLTCAALDEEAEVQGLHEVFQ